MIQLSTTPIDERTTPEDLERIRKNLADAIAELQKQPLAFARLITEVRLVNGVETPIPHSLGRRARVFTSSSQDLVPVNEVRDHGLNPKQYSVLKATGGDVVVDVVLA